jgi:hypothetical protein
LKHRRYGVVVAATLLAVAVFWQVGRAVVSSRIDSVDSKMPAVESPVTPIVSPPTVAKKSQPEVKGSPFATPQEFSAVRKADLARKADEQRQAQRNADNRKLTVEDARRSADEELLQAQTQKRSEETEIRLNHEELSRQQRATLAEQKTPLQVCADRPNFISRGICEAHECEKPERAGLQFCVDINEHRALRDFIN